ncbi:DUF2945 domain-containing protein [Brachybacterium endophyticum]|uniref:DUF2945 domain-containing protein n=1 Tax=Brachybacterium endophyticum TaxID=2182385 RepID=A0A2U2RMW3_9MICO|nr:DUF2945 domain-containing protein [Brachybacterium endophyticum]PWH07210.1 DUF2945 domain-containing protein [Brachybacterium endophyticum]
MRKGYRVAWRTSQGMTAGTIVSRHTADLTFQGHVYRASHDDPVCIVESTSTGKQAAHHESTLERQD